MLFTLVFALVRRLPHRFLPVGFLEEFADSDGLPLYFLVVTLLLGLLGVVHFVEADVAEALGHPVGTYLHLCAGHRAKLSEELLQLLVRPRLGDVFDVEIVVALVLVSYFAFLEEIDQQIFPLLGVFQGKFFALEIIDSFFALFLSGELHEPKAFAAAFSVLGYFGGYDVSGSAEERLQLLCGQIFLEIAHDEIVL